MFSLVRLRVCPFCTVPSTTQTGSLREAVKQDCRVRNQSHGMWSPHTVQPLQPLLCNGEHSSSCLLFQAGKYHPGTSELMQAGSSALFPCCHAMTVTFHPQEKVPAAGDHVIPFSHEMLIVLGPDIIASHSQKVFLPQPHLFFMLLSCVAIQPEAPARVFLFF